MLSEGAFSLVRRKLRFGAIQGSLLRHVWGRGEIK